MDKKDYKALFSYLKTNQKDFAERYGLQASHLSDIVNGKGRKLPVEVLLRLRKEHNISIDWLATGTGSMLEIKSPDSLSDEEKELISEVRQDPKLLDTVKGIIDLVKKNYK